MIFDLLTFTTSVGCDGDHFDILIAGELIKLSSYYSGRWVSQYSVDMTDAAIHVATAGRR